MTLACQAFIQSSGLLTTTPGTWRSTTKQWATSEGVTVPIQAAYDLVGNLFNVQSPTDLDGALSRRLGALIIPGQAGPMVDLDALLLTLVNEFNMGKYRRVMCGG